MKCISCAADIPPSFVHAIQMNVCAGCGGPIMDDASKEILAELSDAMEKMPNDPAGLAGWLLSNYTLRKIGTAEPTNFHRQSSQKKKSESGLKVNSNNPVQKFLNRTGVSKALDERKDLKAIVDMIDSGQIEEGLYGNEQDINEDEEYAGDEEEDYAPTESVARKAFNNQLTVPQAGKKPISVEDAAAMMEAISGSGKDVGDGNRALQEARMERLRKQHDLASGVRVGKNSFSRG